MNGTVAALLVLTAALLVWAPAHTLVLRRLREAAVAERPRRSPDARARGTPVAGPAGGPVRRWLLAGIVGTAAGLLIGGALGLLVGMVGAAAGERFLRRSASDGSGSTALVRDLPAACDLLAVCLSAGMPLIGALAAVATAVPGPVGDELARVAALGRLGADPHRAWADVPEQLRALGRILQRAADSGAGAVSALGLLAADVRARAMSDTEVAVRRAGIRVLAPLGLCFLPAFVCLGVVPLVLGIAGDVLG